MKVVITGHTWGIGKALYQHFQTLGGWEVIGLSRSNGYDIDKDFDKVVEKASGCFLFVNNDYRDKQELAEACRLVSINPNGIDMLHLDLSFIDGQDPDPNKPTDFVSDYNLKFEEIISAVDFWMTNPKVRQMEFRWKLTPFVYTQLKQAFPNLDDSKVKYE